MAPRYIPQNDARLVGWLENFQATAKARGKELGFDDAAIKAAADRAAALIAAIRNDEKLYTDWQAANSRTAELREESLPEFVRFLDRAATSDKWSAETASAFMASSSAPQPVRLDATFKPTFRASVQGGKVRILWTRGALDGVRIESRVGGELEWKPIGVDMRPPFDDPRPLPVKGASEMREYRLIGLHDDKDVGVPSDIVGITVSG